MGKDERRLRTDSFLSRRSGVQVQTSQVHELEFTTDQPGKSSNLFPKQFRNGVQSNESRGYSRHARRRSETDKQRRGYPHNGQKTRGTSKVLGRREPFERSKVSNSKHESVECTVSPDPITCDGRKLLNGNSNKAVFDLKDIKSILQQVEDNRDPKKRFDKVFGLRVDVDYHKRDKVVTIDIQGFLADFEHWQHHVFDKFKSKVPGAEKETGLCLVLDLRSAIILDFRLVLNVLEKYVPWINTQFKSVCIIRPRTSIVLRTFEKACNIFPFSDFETILPSYSIVDRARDVKF